MPTVMFSFLTSDGKMNPQLSASSTEFTSIPRSVQSLYMQSQQALNDGNLAAHTKFLNELNGKMGEYFLDQFRYFLVTAVICVAVSLARKDKWQ